VSVRQQIIESRIERFDKSKAEINALSKICTTSALEIARIVNGDPNGSVFDSNIRRFLGKRGNVNKDILKTCTDVNVSYQFWFLNNGITIII
jgi:AIPR protein